MLINTHHVYGTSIVATDKVAGTVRDVLFDDRNWKLQFLVVRTGRWLTGRSELLALDAVDRADWMARQISVPLSEDEVAHGPTVDDHLPASAAGRFDQSRLVAWDAYWPGLHDETLETVSDPHLESAKEVTGYHIDAADGQLGHVVDFLIDDEDWTIRYLVMDTRNWLPGKHLLVPTARIESIDWETRNVHVNLSREKIQEAPPYEVAVPVTDEYEQAVANYYAAEAQPAGAEG